MDHKEIFQELAKLKIKGIMFHSNMADYYAFLKCCKLKKKHDCQFLKESEQLRDIKERYIMHHERTLLTDDENLSIANITPSSWDEFNLTDEEVKSYIKQGVEEYITFERKTKDSLDKLADALFEDEHYEDYQFVRELADDVIVELSHARDLQTYLAQINFSNDTDDEGLEYRL